MGWELTDAVCYLLDGRTSRAERRITYPFAAPIVYDERKGEVRGLHDGHADIDCSVIIPGTLEPSVSCNPKWRFCIPQNTFISEITGKKALVAAELTKIVHVAVIPTTQ